MWNQQNSRPLVIGHRGAAGHRPENTLSSIEYALSLGVDAVEVDIHFADGRLVVIHDETLERTTNGRGPVAERRIDELRSLDAGGGAQIPLLEEVLDLVRGRAGLVIELKARAAAKLLSAVITREIVEKRWERDRLLVISFDQPALVQLKTSLPWLQIAPLVYGVPHDLTSCATHIGACAYNGHFKSMSEELLNDARMRALRVIVYTPNQIEDLEKMIALGVDGLTTDFPDRALACLQTAAPINY